MIVVVAGVSGSGKTTVARLLAGGLGWSFTDGDQLHPGPNIAKMSGGRPLTDEDRMPWLVAVGEWMDGQIGLGRPAVLACSALKRSYRDLLLAPRPASRMAFLLVDREVAARRLATRHGHFFGAGLLASQFADLEPPVAAERAVFTLAGDASPDQIAGEIVRRLGLAGPAGRPR